MARYTSGYLTEDGVFFKEHEEAKEYELRKSLKEYFCENVTGVTDGQVGHFINALLTKYELTERYNYAAPVKEDNETD